MQLNQTQALLAAVVLALAGCAQPQSDDCAEAAECATPTAGESPVASSSPGIPTINPGTPPPPDNESPPIPDLPEITLENCTGLGAGYEAPYDRVRPLVPAGFWLRGATAETAQVSFDAYQCPRTSNETEIVENVLFFITHAGVVAKNDSWNPDANSVYVLDFLVSSPEVVSELQSWGVNAQEATFAITELPTDDGPIPRWEVSTSTGGFKFDYRPLGFESSPDPGKLYVWFGQESSETLRVDMTGAVSYYDAPDAGVLELEGNSVLAQATGASAFPWAGTPQLSANLVLTPFGFFVPDAGENS